MTKSNRILTFTGVAIYTLLFVLVGLFIFVENDESRPVREIFQWNYLIPAVAYSAVSLWVSYGLFLALRKILNRIISFGVSLVIGIPAGLVLLSNVIELLT